MEPSFDERKQAQRFEGAHDLLHDARVIMTHALTNSDVGIDGNRLSAAIESVTKAQKLMHHMALEIYKSEGIES